MSGKGRYFKSKKRSKYGTSLMSDLLGSSKNVEGIIMTCTNFRSQAYLEAISILNDINDNLSNNHNSISIITPLMIQKESKKSAMFDGPTWTEYETRLKNLIFFAKPQEINTDIVQICIELIERMISNGCVFGKNILRISPVVNVCYSSNEKFDDMINTTITPKMLEKYSDFSITFKRRNNDKFIKEDAIDTVYTKLQSLLGIVSINLKGAQLVIGVETCFNVCILILWPFFNEKVKYNPQEIRNLFIENNIKE